MTNKIIERKTKRIKEDKKRLFVYCFFVITFLLAEGTGPIKKRSKLLKTNKLICAYRGSVNISPMNKITAKKQKLKIKQLQ